jgi:hypothetical protein
VNSILVTAAHCVAAFNKSGIFLGGTTVDGSGSIRYDVEAVLPNPNYGTSELYINKRFVALLHTLTILIFLF